MERVEKKTARGGGSWDSAGVSAVCPGTGTERPAGQRDAGAEQGHEMFPPCPETGRSRNPTGNLAATKPLTWPWYSALRPGVPPARCIPLAAPARGHRRDPSVCQPLLSPWREAERQPPGEGRANPAGSYLSRELSWGCLCPFSGRTLAVASAPASALGLGVWLGFGVRLELGAAVPEEETFPAGSWSVLAIAASRVSVG